MISKILIGAAAAIAAGVGGLEAYGQWENFRFAHASPLAAHLPSNIHEATDEFQRRIRDRFPVGTPQSELVDTLASQGFQLEQGYARAGVQQKAFRHLHLTKMADMITDICRRDWDVSWEDDQNDQLSAVDAKFFFTCP